MWHQVSNSHHVATATLGCTTHLALAARPMCSPALMYSPNFTSGEISTLQHRGFRVHVAELQRRDWFQVARALLTREYWANTSTVDPAYTWYLERVKAAVDEARLASGADQVDIVGHSAGEWGQKTLGRVWVWHVKGQGTRRALCSRWDEI